MGSIETSAVRQQVKERKGQGIKYWLKSLNVLEGQQLVLYGLNENETENYERGRYQLSAQVTGRGGFVYCG